MLAWLRWLRARSWLSATLTAASRIMTPTYPVAFIALGLVYIRQAPSRTESAAFETAKLIGSVPQWGCAFLAIGILEAIALVVLQSRRPRLARLGRRGYVLGLVAGAGVAGFWTALLFASAWSSTSVSYSSGIWPLLGTIAHVASARSLAWHEGEPRP